MAKVSTAYWQQRPLDVGTTNADPAVELEKAVTLEEEVGSALSRNFSVPRHLSDSLGAVVQERCCVAAFRTYLHFHYYCLR